MDALGRVCPSNVDAAARPRHRMVGGHALGVALRRSARRTFGDTSAYARDPELPVFMADLVRPWELATRPEVLAAGLGQTYGEMAEALLPTVVAPDEPVDLLVLAFGMHDIRPGQSAATYLSSRCPGEPAAFAVCDQGPLAPFTALRLIDEYARAGAVERALLVVAEQAALHYRPPARGLLPARHAAVALLLDRTGPARLAGTRQRAGLSPAELSGALAADVAALAGGRGDATLVPGPGLAGVPLPAGVRACPGPAGQPHTGSWWALAGSGPGLVLLADADAGELAVAAVDLPADPGGAFPCPTPTCTRWPLRRPACRCPPRCPACTSTPRHSSG